jgi:SpoIIAA-like
MVYFNERFLTIHWDEDTQAVWAEWKEAVGGEPFHRGLNAGLELIVKKKARKWLADTKLLGAVPTEDVKWTNEDWMPRVLSAGLRCMAFVTPKKVVVQMAVKNVVSNVDENALSVGHFETLDEARAWLRAQK